MNNAILAITSIAPILILAFIISACAATSTIPSDDQFYTNFVVDRFVGNDKAIASQIIVVVRELEDADFENINELKEKLFKEVEWNQLSMKNRLLLNDLIIELEELVSEEEFESSSRRVLQWVKKRAVWHTMKVNQ